MLYVDMDLSRPSYMLQVTCLLYVDMDKCLVTASWDRAVCIHDDMDNDEVCAT